MFYKVLFLYCTISININCFCSQLNSILKSTNFNEIRQSPYFVDKTLIILKTIEHEKSVVFTAPRGFGKSANLDMIRFFLSNAVDYKVAQDLFADTEISKNGNFVKTHLNNYAVIHCSLEPSAPVTDYNSMMSSFRLSLCKAFLQHKYIINSLHLTKTDLNLFEKYVNPDETNFLPSELTSGLSFLSRLLHAHHGKPVILLLDDYDSIILSSLLTKNLGLRDVLEFCDAVFSKTMSDQNVKKSIFTGTSCIITKLLPSLGNTNCIKFLQDRNFEPYFGLTEHDVGHLVDKTVFVNLRPNLTDWYDGYTSPDLSAHIYNTKSLLSCLLSSGELRSYWKNLQIEQALRILLEDNVRKSLLLESTGKVMVVVRELEEVNEVLLEKVKNMVTQEVWDADVSDLFVHLLMEQGYFTFNKPWERSGYKYPVTLRFANLDICESVQIFIEEFIQEKKKQMINRNIV